MNELSLRELESETAVVLPEREALSRVNISRFSIHQTARAFSVDSSGNTTATNSLTFVVVNFHDLNIVSGG